MSFKLFIYYSALCGGWAALMGWLLGQALAPKDAAPLVRAMILGLSLGLFVALGVGMVDALWNLSGHQTAQVIQRGLVVAVVGCLSGLLGAVIGQLLVNATDWRVFDVIGWTLTGLLIGAAVGIYDLGARLQKKEKTSGAVRKILNGILGGVLGGLLGGLLRLLLGVVLGLFFALLGKPTDDLWSGSLWGFVALGACIGLFIGLAQVILKEAWVRVESGFRAGRELILSKTETTIGRAESCDIGLFGDPGIERTHARILLRDNGYLLADAGTSGGTFLNDQRVASPKPLRSGDVIRLGNSVLRFGERQKRK